jgi:hypothetical protein
MASEKIKIKKVLTHDFEIKGEVQNFDDIMQKILDYVRDKLTFLDVEFSKQSNFQSKANTSLVINVKQSVSGIDSYPKVFALKGVSLSNQFLSINSFELEQTEATKNEPAHDLYILQIYNPTDADIVSNVKLQLKCSGDYNEMQNPV